MSSTEETTPAAPAAPATMQEAPAQKVEEPVQLQAAAETTPAQTESVSAPKEESQQTETSQSKPLKETEKIFNPAPSARPFIKPPVPKTIQTDRPTKQSIEQMEEAKLKAKFGGLQKPGGSQFLQTRLNKGLKYFDSGDYNVAKQTGKLKMRPPSSGKPGGLPPAPNPTGKAIPTPDSIHHRKPSSEISKLAV